MDGQPAAHPTDEGKETENTVYIGVIGSCGRWDFNCFIPGLIIKSVNMNPGQPEDVTGVIRSNGNIQISFFRGNKVPPIEVRRRNIQQQQKEEELKKQFLMVMIREIL